MLTNLNIIDTVIASTGSTAASVEISETMRETNFDAVKNFISLNAIQLRQVVSITVLTKLCGGNQGKTYRGIKGKSDSGGPRKINVFSKIAH